MAQIPFPEADDQFVSGPPPALGCGDIHQPREGVEARPPLPLLLTNVGVEAEE